MKRKSKKVKISFRSASEAKPVPIVWDAAIATRGLGEGKLIPLVIVDTTERPDFEELVRAHTYLSPGDATLSWAQLDAYKGDVALIIDFMRPAELTVIINFNVARQGVLIDQILRGRGLYIQPGRLGDRLLTTMDSPRILVEVGNLGFEAEWANIFLKAIVTHFRTKGLNRRQAKEAAQGFIEEWRRIGGFRMGRL
jgi:hypothetical protein